MAGGWKMRTPCDPGAKWVGEAESVTSHVNSCSYYAVFRTACTLATKLVARHFAYWDHVVTSRSMLPSIALSNVNRDQKYADQKLCKKKKESSMPRYVS